MELRDLLKDVQSVTDKKLSFLAWFSNKLRECGSPMMPVLVGGSAVEMYTCGNYGSIDIDLVLADLTDALLILRTNGFVKDGKQWYNEQYDILVEFVGGQVPARITKVMYKDHCILSTSLEEIIIDRMNAAKWWRSKADKKWASIMLLDAVNKPEFDLPYLTQRAEEEDLSDILNEILSMKYVSESEPCPEEREQADNIDREDERER